MKISKLALVADAEESRYEVEIENDQIDAITGNPCKHHYILRLGSGKNTIENALEYTKTMGLNLTKTELVQMLLEYADREIRVWLKDNNFLPIPSIPMAVDVSGIDAPASFTSLQDVASFIPYKLPLDMLLTHILQTELSRWVVKSISGKVCLYQLAEN
jgi:hypothetical protein